MTTKSSSKTRLRDLVSTAFFKFCLKKCSTGKNSKIRTSNLVKIIFYFFQSKVANFDLVSSRLIELINSTQRHKRDEFYNNLKSSSNNYLQLFNNLLSFIKFISKIG